MGPLTIFFDPVSELHLYYQLPSLQPAVLLAGCLLSFWLLIYYRADEIAPLVWADMRSHAEA